MLFARREATPRSTTYPSKTPYQRCCKTSPEVETSCSPSAQVTSPRPVKTCSACWRSKDSNPDEISARHPDLGGHSRRYYPDPRPHHLPCFPRYRRQGGGRPYVPRIRSHRCCPRPRQPAHPQRRDVETQPGVSSLGSGCRGERELELRYSYGSG